MNQRRRRAVLSVTDKSGLAELGRVLVDHGYELVASGGTAAALREAGLEVLDVAELTGQPEILGGRVKTLHPSIAAGILAPRVEDLRGTGFAPIDVVAVNLYDFAAALERTEDEGERIEQIDIGGPTLLRAGAKNFSRVTVLSNPEQYSEFAAELDAHDGSTNLAFRRRCAAIVFENTAAYDELIATRLFGGGSALRYGENPHQLASWELRGGGGLEELGLRLNGGKELSYNNFLDLVATLKLALDMPPESCAVVKHTNPCGVGRAPTPSEALEVALRCDPVSAFGGIVALRDRVDEAAAELLSARFLEVVLAPDYTDGARQILEKKKNLRWLDVDYERFAQQTRGNVRSWGRLVLEQAEDECFPELSGWQLAAGPTPDATALEAAELAWRVAKHVKSNAIVLADARATLGIGAGQMSRIDSCRLAIEKARQAGLELAGCAAASDGFFPFPDGLELLAEAGARTVIQPGGSIRDQEVATSAAERGVTLLITGRRHFRH